jgi:hypothetical protein
MVRENRDFVSSDGEGAVAQPAAQGMSASAARALVTPRLGGEWHPSHQLGVESDQLGVDVLGGRGCGPC